MTTKDSSTVITAEERGYKLMKTPMKDWPPLALEFTKHLGGSFMCGEIFMTGASVYAQCVEGLPCSDSLYKARLCDREWFEIAKGSTL